METIFFYQIYIFFIFVKISCTFIEFQLISNHFFTKIKLKLIHKNALKVKNQIAWENEITITYSYLVNKSK